MPQVMIGASEVGNVQPLVKEGQHVKKVRDGKLFQYNTIQYTFGIETRPGTSQRADSPLMGSS
jgi:hypothetical protein